MTLATELFHHERTLFEDFSGTESSMSSNPYDALIEQCMGDNIQIQARYDVHRSRRNEQQKSRLKANDFERLSPDPILQRIIRPTLHLGYTDPRHCLVFWARPPLLLRQLIGNIQEKLSRVAPNIWLMPLECLHMTVLEIAHSKLETEIRAFVAILMTKATEISDYTFNHRARLIKPILSYDDSAVALSFIPAAGERDIYNERPAEDDLYTYHHLRRDVYSLIKESGVNIASRYTVPSAHLTIARFVGQEDFSQPEDDRALDATKIALWIQNLEEINAWLSQNYWPGASEGVAAGGEWVVGKENGLDFRKGTLWYGGGETIYLGRGF